MSDHKEYQAPITHNSGGCPAASNPNNAILILIASLQHKPREVTSGLPFMNGIMKPIYHL